MQKKKITQNILFGTLIIELIIKNLNGISIFVVSLLLINLINGINNFLLFLLIKVLL